MPFFSIDITALWIVLGVLLAGYLLRALFSRYSYPFLSFSFLQGLSTRYQSGRVRWAWLPKRLYQASLLLFLLAFLDPHLKIPRDPRTDSANKMEDPKEGIAIYIVLDRSGSMAQEIRAQGTLVPKIDLLKQVIERFIVKRPTDLIGLVAFARIPHVLAPLTLDHQLLIEEIRKLQVAQNLEEDGTAMGYAILKTANLIVATRYFAQDLMERGKPAYEIKNTIILVVTDGFQDPSYLDRGNRLRTIELEEAAAYLKQERIRLYIVNVDPNLGTEAFAPHRRLMEKITTETAGKFYLVSDRQGLQQIYDDINRLEKARIDAAETTSTPMISYKRISFYPYLIGLGLLCLLFGLILDTTWLRRAP